ncbi:MAG: hypothetical protein MUE64_00075 [Ignavibacteriaceae bacterium]|nr:hypothetical protein [Ignavibacteriaceae bacterium]
MFVVIKTQNVWKRESLIKKIKSILTLKWLPTERLLNEARETVFFDQVFGDTKDFGNELFKLSKWHNSKEWNIKHLTESDRKKADALEFMTILSGMRYQETSDLLHLYLFERFPFICLLTYPMIVKIPVVSIHYFVNIHSSFAFNSIRKSNHPQADKIIDYLYEILYLQQKIAIALHEFLRLTVYTEKLKSETLLMNSEIDAIMSADLLFSYLKASVEKIIVLVGLTYEITDLDNKHEHNKKLKALYEKLPKKILDIYYVKFMLEFFSSENLDELNNYRSGLLHKRGISDLQPHNYVSKNAESLPLKKIFQVLHEQHSKNASVLLGALAILTDRLVLLDPPQENLEDIYKIMTDK